MKLLELTLSNGNPTMFIINGNFNVTKWNVDSDSNVGCVINDGNHNNGGWKIKESYEVVIAKIKSLA